MTVHVISPLSNRYEHLFRSAEERIYPSEWGRSEEQIYVCLSQSELEHYWFPVMERLKVAGISPDGSNVSLAIVNIDELVIGFVT
jgi:hypothetical protein